MSWIWMKKWSREDEREPRLVYFRGTLPLHAVPAHLPVRITADSRYKLYVNGAFAEMGPSRGDHAVWYVDTVDIAPYLRRGENILAVQVLRYPAEHWRGNHGIYRTKTPGLYVSLDYPVQWRCRAVEDYHIVPESKFFSPLMILERVRGDAALAGWMLPGFADDAWEAPVAIPNEKVPAVRRAVNLVPRTIPFLYRKPCAFRGVVRGTRTWAWRDLMLDRPIEVPAGFADTIDLDAGALTTGYLSLRIAGGAGARIKLLQAECYAGDPVPNPKNPYKALPKKGDRTDCTLELHGFTDHYTPAGYGTADKPEVYEPYWFRTFRYLRVSIETGEEPLIVLGLDYQETGYPLEVRAKVQTSDETLAPIWDISERSLRRCMHETYEDCPFYEQLQYAMDSRSEILYTYASSADDRLAVQCMESFSHALRTDGMINCSYPNYETNVIPGFCIYYIGMLWDHMMYFGDREQAMSCWHAVERILSFFHSHRDERGLVGKIGDVNTGGQIWSFIDWTVAWKNTDGVPPATKQGPITMESLLYLLGLGYAADLADFLGLAERAQVFRQEAEEVRAAVNRHCVGKDGLYQDGPGIEAYSQHSQVFAVLTDTTDLETGRKLLLETLQDPDQYAPCSVAMCWYLFRALEKTGLYAETDRIWDIWRDMVKDHLTTCGEDPVTCRSDCHGWGALALYELPAVLLGVRPGKPGFAEILVSPRTETLDWAEGTVPTPRGAVHVSWKKGENGKVDIQAEGPEGIPLRIETGN